MVRALLIIVGVTVLHWAVQFALWAVADSIGHPVGAVICFNILSSPTITLMHLFAPCMELDYFFLPLLFNSILWGITAYLLLWRRGLRKAKQ